MSEQLTDYGKEDLQRYIQRRVSYPDVREQLINEMISESRQLLNEQDDLKPYQAVDQIKMKYNRQYLEEKIDKMEKAERKEWMKVIVRTLFQQLLHPGIFIMTTIAILAFLFLQFVTPYFLEIMGVAFLIGLFGYFIVWLFHTYRATSSEYRNSLD